jgi:hypothetical protein
MEGSDGVGNSAATVAPATMTRARATEPVSASERKADILPDQSLVSK